MTPALEALTVAYRDLSASVTGLPDGDGWLPTGCAGWRVRDLVQHHLLDGQRALVALATPAGRPADTDAVTYWTDWRPGTDAAGVHRRQVRIMSGVWPRLEGLARLYAETLAAVHHLDLVARLDAPGPGPAPLRAVRVTLDGLLGQPGPASWSDERWALVGTGRAAPTPAEHEQLGPAAERLPLFG